jgi:hypothetical protein
MPYIEIERREEFKKNVNAHPNTPGELNYLFTMILIRGNNEEIVFEALRSTAEEYWKYGPHRYQTINDILGALDGARREYERRRHSTFWNDAVSAAADSFYRSFAGPYEDSTITRNGDVYEKR